MEPIDVRGSVFRRLLDGLDRSQRKVCGRWPNLLRPAPLNAQLAALAAARRRHGRAPTIRTSLALCRDVSAMLGPLVAGRVARFRGSVRAAGRRRPR